MYNTLLIFLWIYLAMIAMAFWESSVEGRKAWDKGKLGWKIKFGKYVILTRYHFYLTFVMIPLLLTLPFIIYGWDFRMFGIILSAYISGLAIEDFTWYVVNPAVRFKESQTKFGSYYPRISIGKIKIPIFYFIAILISFISWYLIWR